MLRTLPILALLLLASCRTAAPPVAGNLTIEGEVTIRGNEPFAEPFLETDDGALYVLTFDGEPPRLATPRRYRLAGTLYLDDWQGQPYAHFRVKTIERVE